MKPPKELQSTCPLPFASSNLLFRDGTSYARSEGRIRTLANALVKPPGGISRLFPHRTVIRKIELIEDLDAAAL
jgi:hypothetical protein